MDPWPIVPRFRWRTPDVLAVGQVMSDTSCVPYRSQIMSTITQRAEGAKAHPIPAHPVWCTEHGKTAT
jgi:hypothetical protein